MFNKEDALAEIELILRELDEGVTPPPNRVKACRELMVRLRAIPEPDPVFWAIGDGHWGRGFSVKMALENLYTASNWRKGSKQTYLVYRADIRTDFLSDGSFVTPTGVERPVVIQRVRLGKEVEE